MEIPKFLLEMSDQINNQNNMMTADPLFEVRYKSYLITQEDYNESHWEIFCEDGYTLYHSQDSEDFSALAEYMFDYDYDWCVNWFDYKNTDLEFSESNFKDLFTDEFEPDYDDLPSDVKKLYLQEVEVTVNSHFTESDAQAFIDRKQHDYRELYIYAISMCYCKNMKKLRNWIKDLTTWEIKWSNTTKEKRWILREST